jgi:hypothetical protein
MPRKRFAEEQIAFALRQHEGGSQDAKVIRKLGGDGTGVLPLEEEVRRFGRLQETVLEKA